jgi:hypothetical protein
MKLNKIRDLVNKIEMSMMELVSLICCIGGAQADLLEDLENYNRRQWEAFRRSQRT